MDIGIKLCYLLYFNKISPNALKNIHHELIHASSLFYYLYSNGKDLDEILKNISHGN